MHFSTLILTTVAALATATPATLTRRADCPEAEKIPLCGASPLSPPWPVSQPTSRIHPSEK